MAVKNSGHTVADSVDLPAITYSTANITARQNRQRQAVENTMRKTDVKPIPFVSELCCDRCGTEAKHDEADGFNNFLQIEFDASWGSAIGDGTHVEVDLCHACLKETLGPWLRLSASAWNRPPYEVGGQLSESVAKESDRPAGG